MTGIRALYLHIPFCHAKCAYCDFDSRGLCGAALERAADAYVAQLRARVELLGERGALEDVRTAYIGGGTPTVLGPRLPELVRFLRRWCAPDEVTSEANPESFTDELARMLRAAGVTRISLGVQSLDDAELRAIGRLHDRAGALDALARARREGFSVSCDLMCGLPGQTAESWGRTLAGVVGAGPDHVSVYPLTIEDGTPLAAQVARDPALEPDEDFQASCMEEAARALRAAGYERYEVASYARPGHACRHNMAYWTGVPYLGVGRSAAGMLTGAQFLHLASCFPGAVLLDADDPLDLAGIHADDRVRIVQRDDAATSFEVEVLLERSALAEDLMLGMRCSRGVGAALLDRARAMFGDATVNAALATAQAEGLATWHAGRFVPMERGWLMGNELFGLFWDLASDDEG